MKHRMCLCHGLKILWIKVFVSVFFSMILSCSMIVHIFKDKLKVAGDIDSLNLLVISVAVDRQLCQ